MKNLLESRTYSPEEIDESVLIWYPHGKDKFNYTPQPWQEFNEGGNFFVLENPIRDEFGNVFHDSEGFYMAQRTDDLEIKKAIAELSKTYAYARKARKLYEDHLEQDIEKRAEYMRNAVRAKFDMNPEIREKLLATGDRQLIEYTYRGDINFGIDQNTLEGKNILGKLQMQYRDEVREILASIPL